MIAGKWTGGGSKLREAVLERSGRDVGLAVLRRLSILGRGEDYL